MMKLGAQLYTVREFTQTTDALAETLAKVADIGYTSVQVSGTGPYEPAWLKEQLQKNGLVCPVTHTNPDRIADETAAVVEEHNIFGCPVVGIGSAPGGFENGFSDLAAFTRRFLPAAKILQEKGCVLGYHNHHFEFIKENGMTLLEKMAADFPPELLTFILDTYWVQYSGGDPAAFIKKMSGRVQCVHLKDLAIVNREQRMAVVGEGNINFDAVFSACEGAGTQYLLVEQDDCYGEDPFACLKRSYEYLKAQGLS